MIVKFQDITVDEKIYLVNCIQGIRKSEINITESGKELNIYYSNKCFFDYVIFELNRYRERKNAVIKKLSIFKES